MRPRPAAGQGMAEMIILTLLVSAALLLAAGAFRAAALRAADTALLAVILPFP